jgi:hypothetical protein
LAQRAGAGRHRPCPGCLAKVRLAIRDRVIRYGSTL